MNEWVGEQNELIYEHNQWINEMNLNKWTVNKISDWMNTMVTKIAPRGWAKWMNDNEHNE